MLVSTDERVGKGLKLLRAGLLPFVEQEMTKRYGSEWYELPEVGRLLQQQPKKKGGKPHLDTQALLNILWNYWNDVFTHTLHQEERNLVSELRMARNKCAHDETFSIEDTYRVFDSIGRLLTAVSDQEVTEVEQIKQELIKQLSSQQIGKTDSNSHTVQNSIHPDPEIVIPAQTVSSTVSRKELKKVIKPGNKLKSETATVEESELAVPNSIQSWPTIEAEKLPSPAPVQETAPLPKTIPMWAKGISLLLAFSAIALSIKSAPYFLKPKLQASSLTIGTLGSPKYQAELADYLKEELVPADFGQFLLGKQVQVLIDGDKTLPYQEAERRIANKEWDIAFTLSPVISVAAKDNGYTFAAQMFPGNGRYQSALFVRADSPIKSTDDLKPSTVIALGGFNSASSFYMPAYDLFGKTLAADMGHRGPEILEMVKTGKADVGAAAVGDTVKADDPSIRIIHLSRDLPGSGVYLSPNLSTSDRQTIAKALLSVPQEIQKKANYGAGKEADYSLFREIISKAESIQICSDFTKNPVNFFCPDSYKPVTLAGKVNGWSHKSNAHVLNVREQSGKTYRVAVPPQLLNEAIGNSDPLAIQGKEIQVKTGMTPQRLGDGSFELELTQARQLNMLISAKSADVR